MRRAGDPSRQQTAPKPQGVTSRNPPLPQSPLTAMESQHRSPGRQWLPASSTPREVTKIMNIRCNLVLLKVVYLNPESHLVKFQSS